MTLTKVANVNVDGRDIKIKIVGKKKDKYGYIHTFTFGLTTEGYLLTRRSEYGSKYWLKGKIDETPSEEFLREFVTNNGYEIVEKEKKEKNIEPVLNQWEMSRLLKAAQEAGLLAGKNARPTPMRVVEHVNPFDDNSPIAVDYGIVDDGVCGFAWVHFPRANTRFVNFLKKKDLGHNAYQGGYDYWVREFGQSMDRKEAYARAFARVILDAGIDCYSQSKMD